MAATSNGATVSLYRQSRLVTSGEIAAGVPAGVVHDFFVTTQSDLLSINAIAVDVPLYQHQLGSDRGPAATALVELDAAIGADSFIQMPGDTIVLGSGFSDGVNSLWGDLSDNGPQQDFLFARLTTSDAGAFSGNLALSTDFGVESISFQFQLPGLVGLSPANSSHSVQLDFIPPPLPEPPTPIIETPAVEPSEIEVVEVLPPTIELPLVPPNSPEHPQEPWTPPVGDPVDDRDSGADIQNGYEFPRWGSERPIDSWISWPGYSVGLVEVTELARLLESVQLSDISDARLLVNSVATMGELSGGFDLRIEMHSFSTANSLNDSLLASVHHDSAGRSSSVPEPLSASLGAVAIATAIGFRRKYGTGSFFRL